MDSNSKKILKFLLKNKGNNYSISKLVKYFPEIPKDYIIEIIHTLYKNNYIRYVTDSSIRITNQGETFFSVSRSNWISENIVSILALVVSICAFIEATISLLLSQ